MWSGLASSYGRRTETVFLVVQNKVRPFVFLITRLRTLQDISTYRVVRTLLLNMSCDKILEIIISFSVIWMTLNEFFSQKISKDT